MKNSIDETDAMEKDFATLARLAVQGSSEDARLLLGKLVRRYRTTRPELADRFNTVLRAAHTRSSHGSVLRESREAQRSGQALINELPMDVDSKMPLVRIFDDGFQLQAPLLTARLFKQVESLIRERQQRQKLLAHGVAPRRSAILVGPPGVGKTLSARWIAAQIGKPLWVLDLTTVMSSLLGKTGSNLRAVFDHARTREAVLLLDEIDAIAKRRSDASDVGELKRLVSGILQEVDAWPDSGLLLAATNHPELVDPALWRRFDAVLEFEMNEPELAVAAVKRFLGTDAPLYNEVVGLLAASLHGCSFSEVEREVVSMRRSIVLDSLDPRQALLEVAERRVQNLDKAARLQLAIELARTKTLSHNKIMSLTGVARDTIRKYAGPSPIKGRGGKRA